MGKIKQDKIMIMMVIMMMMMMLIIIGIIDAEETVPFIQYQPMFV